MAESPNGGCSSLILRLGKHYPAVHDTLLTMAMQKCYRARQFRIRTLGRGIVAALALSLAGCLATNLEKYNRIDPRQKTIFIPAENEPLIGTIAQGLRADGWQVADAVPPAAAAPLRYRIDIRQIRVDPEFCDAGGGPVVKFDLVMYDNRTSDAAVTYRGRDCSNWAATAFLDAVRRYVKHPRREFDD